ncbi:M20 aminoacylase family protein [Paracoccus benzoatiresistens]|uniref:M20 family metallopeptidase n=1 Tax=Paracoccus benzoatiresistens TaxID=2997341 RepID=A0ABT4JAI1_9RHOB|nr:M20 aminoacylase family protein [Paracoccus sp. EF6]MCZ0964078.1 M20 family metallopeptidase [Paracoccus sp. EF6]
MIPASHLAEAVEWRRRIHMNPELAFEEHDTAAFIAGKLGEWGYEVATGIGRTGIVGSLTKGAGNRAIGIRADMDALPILESSGADWCSQRPGRAHSCGHDGHVAVALAAARVLADTPFDGTLRFIFQPAEENEGGGREMVADGLFTRFPVDAIYAMHNWPGLPVGTLVARDREMMAAFATFEIELTGKGAHGAMPHEGADTLLAASHIVTALQSITSRNVSPLRSSVVSVTQVHGGDAWNVLPETAVVRGTTRWFDPEVGDLLEARMNAIVAAVATGFDCAADLRYQRRYPSTLNTPGNAALLRGLGAEAGLEIVDTDPSMAAEDFAFMLEHAPGCYFWLGAAREGANPGLHSPRFDFNDAILGPAAAFWVRLAQAELGGA